MGSEDGKMVNRVGKGHGRFSGMLAVAVLVILVASIPSVSLTAIAFSDSSEQIEVAGIDEGPQAPKTDVEIPHYMTSLSKPKEAYKISERQSFSVEPYGFETFTSTHLTDFIKQTSDAGDPSPQGSPDPEPYDAPFQDPDILVYNDAVNSQMNVDMASTTNGDLYTVYDHDPGGGMRDVYVSKSTDAGTTWMQRNVATDGGEDEYCPTIASDFSQSAGAELIYSFYTADQLEFRWSSDGDTWNLVDFGGGVSPFQGVCPDMDVMDDFIVVAGETVSPGDGRDTWRVLYTVDGSSWTSYYFNMWPGAWVYQPRISIQSYDDVNLEGDVVVTMTIHDQSDPNPANWYYEAVLSDATLTGDLATDDWGVFYYMSGVPNLDLNGPDVEANDREVIFNMGIYNPSVLPLTVHYTWCLFADDVDDIGSASWDFCAGTGFIAFDGTDTNSVKYVAFYRESTAVHAVWLNGTDINYYYSANGGLNFEGNSLAGGDPYKVNMPGVGTAIDAWRSPEVLNVAGKPCVAWHDTRGSNSIYFNTLGNVAFFEIDTNPSIWDLWVMEVGDLLGWHPPPYSYLWNGGSLHDVTTIGFFEIPNDTRYTFVDWDDGSPTNPTQITVAPPNRIVANYQTEYYLDMVNPGGTTNPATGYQLAGATVTIEAFAPAAPPGAQYIWIGWTGIGAGSYSGPLNPCTNCVVMNEKIQQFANWQLQWEVTFDTVPTGLDLEVDGATQPTPFTTWFNDSQFYNINAPSPQGVAPTRYVFSSWDDGGPQSHNVFVSEPSFFNATFRPEFWLTIDTNPTGLTILVDSVPRVAPYSFWCPDGGNPWLDANSPQYTGVLGERWLWREWSDGGAESHPYICSGPATVYANYTKQHSVNITTTPGDFQVIVDGQSLLAPLQYWWNDTSMHTLEALQTITVGPNQRFNFTGWSDLGARVHPYWANTSDDTVTASYILQHKITLQANFPGLSIDLDSSTVALPLVYWCDVNTQHILDAPSIQTFGDTRYVYNSWSDGLGQVHTILCDATQTIRVDYDQEFRVRVNSTQIGVGAAAFNVIIGGTTYSTPAEVWWPASTMMSLDAEEFQPTLDPLAGTRYRFVDWEDSAIKARSENINEPKSYVANFIAQHKLMFSDAHGSPFTTPAGYPVVDGTYFDEGTSVAIETDSIVVNTADSRWRFVRWDSTDTGGYSGTDNPGTVTMLGPITQSVTWMDQFLLTLVSTYGVPAASGWADQESATEFWYDQGATANFWVEAEVIIATGEKAVFSSWNVNNGTAINSPMTATASWTFAYLVTVVSDHGTLPDPNPDWIANGGTYALTIEEFDPPTGGTTRYRFSGWTTADTGNGGYQGANRQATLTVSGPITETATWTTEHLLDITSSSGSEENLGDPRIIPPEEWVEDGTTVTVEVDSSVTIGDTKYTFKRWVGPVADPNSPSTTIVMTGPVILDVEWDSEPVFSIMDLWWLFVIIIIVVVVLVALLLMRKKKPTEEMPPAEEEFPGEEFPGEETPPAPE